MGARHIFGYFSIVSSLVILRAYIQILTKAIWAQIVFAPTLLSPLNNTESAHPAGQSIGGRPVGSSHSVGVGKSTGGPEGLGALSPARWQRGATSGGA